MSYHIFVKEMKTFGILFFFMRQLDINHILRACHAIPYVNLNALRL